jgi:C4-dicarboxylate-binding protein DctP
MVITNKVFWDGLPADIRAELGTILAQVTEEVKMQAVEQARRDRQALIEAGSIEVISLTEEERKNWRQAMIPVWDVFTKQIDPALIAAAQAANNPGH